MRGKRDRKRERGYEGEEEEEVDEREGIYGRRLDEREGEKERRRDRY